MQVRQPGNKQQRAAVVLIAVMTCLAVAIAIVGSMTQRVIRQRRQLVVQQQHHQTQWLVESGAERAAHRLAERADYEGEVWQLAADQLGGDHSAEVAIHVTTHENQTASVRVVARYPAQSIRAVQQSKTFMISLAKMPTE